MFREGHAPIERKLAVCMGTIPLEPADRAELLVLLAKDPDDRIAERSANALLTLQPSDFIAALGRSDAAPQLFEYCAENLIDKPGISAGLISNFGCPLTTLIFAVRHLPADEVKAMAENIGLLSVRPELAQVLLTSPALGPDHREMLEELGQGAEDEEILAEAVKDAEADPGKRQSLLQRLAKMRVTERMQLAFRGGREERMALIRDSCRIVQRAVMQSPKLSEREVEGFASMTSLSEEVLRLIATTRSFQKNYVIRRNLVFNPKVPLDVSLRLLPHMMTPDMRTLSQNKNIPETLRTTAIKFYRQRTADHKSG